MVLMILLICSREDLAFAQNQPTVEPEPAKPPVVKPPDPLRDAALSAELLDLVKQPLPPPDGQTETRVAGDARARVSIHSGHPGGNGGRGGL